MEEIKTHSYYTRAEFTYLPREAYVESVTETFYKLYYPRQNF